jgi:hypothetical protein
MLPEFVLDDSAATTLQSSPATLRLRRAGRVALVVPLLASWWVLAALIVSSSTVLPIAAYTLQFATLVGIGLAGASTTSRNEREHSRGGTTGALAVIICFGTAFLPERALQLVPVDPATPDSARQLIVTLVAAVAVQLSASADPARRMHV